MKHDTQDKHDFKIKMFRHLHTLNACPDVVAALLSPSEAKPSQLAKAIWLGFITRNGNQLHVTESGNHVRQYVIQNLRYLYGQ